MELHEEILNLLKKKAAAEHEYINPKFLQEITDVLEVYYQCEDDGVNRWVTDMFGA